MLVLVHGLLLGAFNASKPVEAKEAHGRRAGDCARPFQPCFDSKCCHGEPRYGCHKRQGRAFALCKRVDEGGCTTDDMFQCPTEWEDCTTPSFGNCWDSMCCADPGMGCMRRGARSYAMCRPLRDCEAVGSEWVCPGAWTKPAWATPQSAVAHAPPPPPKHCSQPFQCVCTGSNLGTA